MVGTPAAPAVSTVTIRGLDQVVALRGDRMVVGRLASCDVCLADANTSRQHAAFVREGAGWSIEDLGSTNGTIVNGTRIESLRLRDGDTIVIGVTELIYHEPRPVA
jgi:pSer/pThr/pTyr-binding forkhead associated (FHA) protein